MNPNRQLQVERIPHLGSPTTYSYRGYYVIRDRTQLLEKDHPTWYIGTILNTSRLGRNEANTYLICDNRIYPGDSVIAEITEDQLFDDTFLKTINPQ
jgi:hypothetical protein